MSFAAHKANQTPTPLKSVPVSAKVSALVLAAMVGLGTPLRADAEALSDAQWTFDLSGEARIRYETLDGQFRAGGKGGDQLVVLRTLIKGEAVRGPFAFVAEIEDSRSYIGDDGTPYTTSWINPADFLQAHVRIALPDVPGQAETQAQLGRMTLHIGSGRQIERVDFANAIFNYTGLHLNGRTHGGARWHALYVVPVTRLPTSRAEMAKNRLSGDEEATRRHLWGLHYIRPNSLKALASDLTAEAFVYGLKEEDTSVLPTPNRDYLTYGGRLFRAPKAGQWDLDVELALRTGTRRATSQAADTRDLKVRAHALHAFVGRTFQHPWQPRMALELVWASGDKSPTDGRYDQFERLFGSRRTDLGNTGIHGPLTPANIVAPGARIEIRPSNRWDARLAYKHASLASATDSWVVAGVRDPSGQSGRFIGHSLDGRVRYWIRPKALLGEIGGSALFGGDVGRRAPNAARQGDSYYSYAQVTGYF
ncbi:MAG: alginate export family protein [Asticcacaulis sp.]